MAFQSFPISTLLYSFSGTPGAPRRSRLALWMMAVCLACSMGVQAQGTDSTDGKAGSVNPAAISTPMAPRPISNAPTSTASQPTPVQPGGAAAENAAAGAAQTAAPTQRAPNASNEFQRFVASATGETLPVFGESYFSATTQTFAPLDRVPVPADYVLGPGDELYIRT